MSGYDIRASETRANKPKLQITKLDAALRQLRTAIRLWFSDGDPVAIHTLISASHEIIHTLYRRAGHSDLFFDSVVVKDEYRSEFARLMKAPATFFKHAQRDPDAELAFPPAINEPYIMFSLVGLHRMGVAIGVEESAFGHWLALHRPEWMAKDSPYNPVHVDALEYLRGVAKHEFFEAYELAWRKHRRAAL